MGERSNMKAILPFGIFLLWVMCGCSSVPYFEEMENRVALPMYRLATHMEVLSSKLNSFENVIREQGKSYRLTMDSLKASKTEIVTLQGNLQKLGDPPDDLSEYHAATEEALKVLRDYLAFLENSFTTRDNLADVSRSVNEKASLAVNRLGEMTRTRMEAMLALDYVDE